MGADIREAPATYDEALTYAPNRKQRKEAREAAARQLIRLPRRTLANDRDASAADMCQCSCVAIRPIGLP
jgi:hypothetical protein